MSVHWSGPLFLLFALTSHVTTYEEGSWSRTKDGDTRPEEVSVLQDGPQAVEAVHRLSQLLAGEARHRSVEEWPSDVQFWNSTIVGTIHGVPPAQRNRNRRSLNGAKGKHRRNKTRELLREQRRIELYENGLMELSNSSLGFPGRAGDLLRIEQMPRHGRILVRGEPAQEFTGADLAAQVVVYAHDGEETGRSVLRDSFSISTFGGALLEVRVDIQPIDDTAPRIRIEGNLKVKEGGKGKLSTRQLKIEDPDTKDEDVTCYVIAQAMFGELKVAERTSAKFDYSQLKSGLVSYEQNVHLGMEPREDGLSIACYDTENNTESGNNFGIINISIESVNDEKPTITPKLLSVSKGGEVSLSKDAIIPKDPDTPLERLTFVLEAPPSKGVVMKKVGFSEYQDVKNFSFSEMDDVYYRSGAESGEDKFVLSVSDGAHHTTNQVRVSIQPEESTPQLLVNEGLEIEEGSTALITTQILYAEDLGTHPENIIFIIRDTPLFGSLLLDREELTPGSKFTQSSVSSSQLSYRHIDPSSSMDVFVFDITDGKNTLLNQNFFITILSHNHTYPEVTSDVAIVSPLSTLLITPDILRVKNAEDVEFHVMSPPRQGRLELRGKSEPILSFTYSDVEEKRVQYVHLSNKSAPEIIQFEVSDGQNSIFHTFNINFTTGNPHFPLPAEALVSSELTEETITSKPVILTNNPIRSLKTFEDGAIGAVISRRNLYAEDDGRNITYVIADPPKYGYLLNRRTNNSCGNFTQDDVNAGKVIYTLKPGAKVPGDAVLLNVLGQGLPLKGLQFIMEWSWVQFKTNSTIADEKESLVKIPLVRWGSLTESAFVGVRVEGGNATINEDYTRLEEQVQFSPGQSVAFLNVHILEDTVFEGPEEIILSLLEPYSLLIDQQNTSTIVIDDREDEPKYSFLKLSYEAFENTSELALPIERSGDSSQEATLECITENGEAEGGDGLDFSPQPGIPFLVVFPRGETKATCSLVIHDDVILEPEEYFWVKLKSGGKELSLARITILPDDTDIPTVSFLSDTLVVHETDGEISVSLIVTGEREILNASVSVMATSMSAKANIDFIFHKSTITMTPEENTYMVHVVIIDDRNAKKYEGNETFLLSLVEPNNCIIGQRGVTAITIQDESDVPVLQFVRSNYSVSENVGQIDLEIERQGDMIGQYNVICYINEDSGTFLDFTFPSNGTYQVITFQPGEMKKNCSINLHDDDIFESNEHFTVSLKPESKYIKIGDKAHLTITVSDEEDREIIFFHKSHYFVKEPPSASKNGSVTVDAIREGDSKYASHVRVYTKDGTARSGEDYVGKSAVMTLAPGQRSFSCEIQILFDREAEIKEYFTIHLDVQNDGETLYSRKAIIYIFDSPHAGGIMFPAPPTIYSPRRLDDSKYNGNYVTQGVPLVCVSVCNKQHRLHKRFEHWCRKHEISDLNTKYSWQVEDKRGKLVDVPFPAYFARGRARTLEGVYVRGGSRLRCGAAPDTGKNTFSELAEVSKKPGACPQPSENMIGAEPFIAQISYAEGLKEKTKLIKISVTIPHYDGLFPAISTHHLGDAFQILKSYTPRAEIHKCSNIVTKKELQTKFGFLLNGNNDPVKTFPVELQTMRESDAVDLYRHLDLESCVWNFEGYYTLDEAVNLCGATINSESNLYDTERTSVTLEMPLYVTYYTYSVFGWQHTDTSIVLRLTFLYEGSVLSDEGVVKQEDEKLEGLLHPTNMHISENGSLAVFFRTTTKFPGVFLLHTDDSYESFVHSLDHPEMPIILQLIRNTTRNQEEEQYWVFHSEFSSEDYTGRYEVSLVPCVFVDTMEVCTPRPAIVFPLDIHLQQIGDPVLNKYSLNTSFHLVKKREAAGSLEESSMFEPGDHVYGFIKMDPPQSQLKLVIDQCYVCSGRKGRTPRYDPKRKEFGCLMESPDLQYSVKIIDRHVPESAQSSHEMNFNATLIRNKESEIVTSLLDAQNVDIFYFDITPLFRLRSGKVWFVHCTFTIRSSGEGRLWKRSVTEGRRGTNMGRLVLRDPRDPSTASRDLRPASRDLRPASSDLRPASSAPRPAPRGSSRALRPVAPLSPDRLHLISLAVVFAVLLLSLLLTFVLLCYIVRVKRELSDKKKTTYTNVNYRECLTNDCVY